MCIRDRSLTINENKNCSHAIIMSTNKKKLYYNCPTPVSYTHLDVYKRQRYGNGMKGDTGNKSYRGEY